MAIVASIFLIGAVSVVSAATPQDPSWFITPGYDGSKIKASRTSSIQDTYFLGWCMFSPVGTLADTSDDVLKLSIAGGPVTGGFNISSYYYPDLVAVEVVELLIVVDGGVSGSPDGYAFYDNGPGSIWINDEEDLALTEISFSALEADFGDMSILLGFPSDPHGVYVDPVVIEPYPVVIDSPVDGDSAVQLDGLTVELINNVNVGDLEVYLFDADENILEDGTFFLTGTTVDISGVVEFGKEYNLRAFLVDSDTGDTLYATPGYVTFTVEGCIDDSDCDDDVFCNGEEVCGVSGQCEAGVEPCNADEVCDDEADQCFGKMCTESNVCDFTSECVVPGGETDGLCTRNDTLDQWEYMRIGEGGWWAFPKKAYQADDFVLAKGWDPIVIPFDVGDALCAEAPSAVLMFRPRSSNGKWRFVAGGLYPDIDWIFSFQLPYATMPDGEYESKIVSTHCGQMEESTLSYFEVDLQQ